MEDTLIEKDNPFWEDLAVSVLGFEPLASNEHTEEERSHPGERQDP